MKRTIILSIICFWAFIVTAQNNTEKKYSISLFGTGGVHFISDVTTINTVFKKNGIPSLNNYLPAYHVGIRFDINRFLIQFNERTYDLTTKSKSNYEISAIGEGYEAKFGYDLVKSRKVDLYPYVGLGAHEVTWQIDPASPAKLEDAINNLPTDSYQLKVANEQIGTAGILIDVCVYTCPRERFMLMLGGDFHYLYGTNGRWYLNNQLVDVGEDNLSGFSAMLTLSLKAQLDKFKK